MLMEILFISRKFEGYIPSGIGACWKVGWLAGDKNVISFEIFKFSSGQTLQRLAYLNEEIALLELYLSIAIGFSYSDFIMLFT